MRSASPPPLPAGQQADGQTGLVGCSRTEYASLALLDPPTQGQPDRRLGSTPAACKGIHRAPCMPPSKARRILSYTAQPSGVHLTTSHGASVSAVFGLQETRGCAGLRVTYLAMQLQAGQTTARLVVRREKKRLRLCHARLPPAGSPLCQTISVGRACHVIQNRSRRFVRQAMSYSGRMSCGQCPPLDAYGCDVMPC